MNRQIPESVDKWASDTIGEISDEVGSETKGDYLLHYEGWSAFCLDDVVESLPPDADVEEELFDAANDRSQGVIDEWVEDNAPDYALVESGHERTGLYGVTWALFKRTHRR
jgi:hypothetical protein